MKYLSICSGIEAATVAWHPLGWQPLAFSEIEPFPSAVLAHHWPDVPNLGDMTKFHEWRTIRPNLIVGGTPCQAFSVAGLRKGLEDPRGNLTLTFLAIVAQHRPAWVVWENVPGVLSDRTGAFGSFLGGLAELGYGWAYRVLDAQYFGVAQRRRRVFVVANLGGWGSAAAVLFERESLLWHPAPSRKAREEVASYTKGSFGSYNEGCGTLRANGGDLGGGSETLLTPARMSAFGEYVEDETASCMKQRDYKAATDLVTHCIAENIIGRQDHNGGNGAGHQEELSYTLNTVAAPAVAITQFGDIAGSLTARHDSSPCADRGMNVVAMGIDEEQNAAVELMGTLKARMESGGFQGSVMLPNLAVRRLTPTECERLQGFPDGHTLIPWRGKPASECPDSPRYKALGNSMAVPVMRWIGERIKLIDNL